MKKLLFCISVLMFITSPVYAEKIDMECTPGTAEGWIVWYEKGSGFDNEATFHFGNLTGNTAFKYSFLLMYYDYFGKVLGSHTIKLYDYYGPLRNGLELKTTKIFPGDTREIACEIYWSDTL